MRQLLCHCQGRSEEQSPAATGLRWAGYEPAPIAPRPSWLRRIADRAVPRADLTLMHEVHTQICVCLGFARSGRGCCTGGTASKGRKVSLQRCERWNTSSYSRGVRGCGSVPAEANLAWPWLPGDLDHQEPCSTSGAVPCWHLGPSLRCSAVRTSACPCALWQLPSTAGEVCSRGAGEGSGVGQSCCPSSMCGSSVGPLLEDGWCSPGGMWVSCPWTAASTRCLPWDSQQSPSAPCTKGEVRFCTHWTGLTLTKG